MLTSVAGGISGFTLILFIAIIIAAVIISHRKRKRKLEEARRRTAETVNMIREAKISAQKTLIERYAKSPATKEALDLICRGNTIENKPIEIVIDHQSIKGRYGNDLIVYEFSAHGLPELPASVETILSERGECDIIRHQVAMADAINSLLDESYTINDCAKRSFDTYTVKVDSNNLAHTYVSDHVLMKLKPTRTF